MEFRLLFAGQAKEERGKDDRSLNTGVWIFAGQLKGLGYSAESQMQLP